MDCGSPNGRMVYVLTDCFGKRQMNRGSKKMDAPPNDVRWTRRIV